MSLIANSIEAMKGVDGGRTFSIKSERGDNHDVVVSVSDTGVGLPHGVGNIFEGILHDQSSWNRHGTQD